MESAESARPSGRGREPPTWCHELSVFHLTIASGTEDGLITWVNPRLESKFMEKFGDGYSERLGAKLLACRTRTLTALKKDKVAFNDAEQTESAFRSFVTSWMESEDCVPDSCVDPGHHWRAVLSTEELKAFEQGERPERGDDDDNKYLAWAKIPLEEKGVVRGPTGKKDNGGAGTLFTRVLSFAPLDEDYKREWDRDTLQSKPFLSNPSMFDPPSASLKSERKIKPLRGLKAQSKGEPLSTAASDLGGREEGG